MLDRSRPTVLVATADRRTRDAIDEVLSDAGYDVVLAADTAQARAAVERLKPPLVLVDRELRGGSAESLIVELDPGVRAILLTNTLAIDATRLAAEVGAAASLNRPLDLTLMLCTVMGIAPVAAMPQSASVAC